MIKPERLYWRRFAAAMTAYVILLIASIYIVKWLDGLPRLVVSLLPIVPILFGVGAFLAYLRQMDEMQRRIEFEAFAFSLGLTGVISFTLGLMENAGLPPVGIIWVFPMIIFFWSIGRYIAERRYK
jgi:hypothetical protein